MADTLPVLLGNGNFYHFGTHWLNCDRPIRLRRHDGVYVTLTDTAMVYGLLFNVTCERLWGYGRRSSASGCADRRKAHNGRAAHFGLLTYISPAPCLMTTPICPGNPSARLSWTSDLLHKAVQHALRPPKKAHVAVG